MSLLTTGPPPIAVPTTQNDITEPVTNSTTLPISEVTINRAGENGGGADLNGLSTTPLVTTEPENNSGGGGILAAIVIVVVVVVLVVGTVSAVGLLFLFYIRRRRIESGPTFSCFKKSKALVAIGESLS
jgi:hypothetical protein